MSEADARGRQVAATVEKIVERHMALVTAVSEASRWVDAAANSIPAVERFAHQLDLVDLTLGATISTWLSSAWRATVIGPADVAPLTEWAAAAVAEARVRGRTRILDAFPPRAAESGPRAGHYEVGGHAIARLSGTYKVWSREFDGRRWVLDAVGWGEPTTVYGQETYQHVTTARDGVRAAYQFAVEAAFRPVLLDAARPLGATDTIALWMHALRRGDVDSDPVLASLEPEFGDAVATVRRRDSAWESYAAAHEG